MAKPHPRCPIHRQRLKGYLRVCYRCEQNASDAFYRKMAAERAKRKGDER